jgi:tRNA pseudouridine38-40 synthase
MRIALGIEYDGTAYNGWQRQRVGHGVQEPLEAAVSSVADEPVEVVCAGRTDTGVHAAGQVAHFDTASDRSERSWVLGANTNLPDDISVTWAKAVDEAFHARFSATSRTYQYLILNRLQRSALYRRRAWWVHEALDVAAMQAAGEALIGEHDFSAFRAAGCQAAHATREITALTLERRDEFILLEVTANAFLQHMVRNITGTLVEIGRGDRPVSWAADVLASRDRKAGGIAAPPHGLTLVAVEYPPEFAVPAIRMDVLR